METHGTIEKAQPLYQRVSDGGERQSVFHAAELLKQITVENFPNLLKDTNLQIQEAETNLHRRNTKRLVQLRHKIIFLKTNDKEKVSIQRQISPLKLWSSEGGSTILQMLKEKNCTSPLQVTKASFKSEENKIKAFLDEGKLKGCDRE